MSTNLNGSEWNNDKRIGTGNGNELEPTIEAIDPRLNRGNFWLILLGINYKWIQQWKIEMSSNKWTRTSSETRMANSIFSSVELHLFPRFFSDSWPKISPNIYSPPLFLSVCAWICCSEVSSGARLQGWAFGGVRTEKITGRGWGLGVVEERENGGRFLCLKKKKLKARWVGGVWRRRVSRGGV